MSISDNDLGDGINDELNIIDLLSPTPSFRDMLENFDLNQECSPSTFISDISNTSAYGFSPESNPNFNNQDPTTTIAQNAVFPPEMRPSPERLEIIAQPYYPGTLRYRSTYQNEKRRRAALQSRNNPNYKVPAVRIPQSFLNLTQKYYIRVCPVTVIHETTNCLYLHPYELEHIDLEEYNDRENNAVWFPIQYEDFNGGIKSFSDIRIVKKTEPDLESYGKLRVFDGCNPNILNNSVPGSTSAKDIIREYNLKKIQLAFTIGKKRNENDKFPTILYHDTTIFSEEMTDDAKEDPDADNEVGSSSIVPPDCRMYKYAPRKGYTDENEEVLIFYMGKLGVKKYGALQVTFEYDTWSESVLDLDVKDQMVSFKTPQFPFSINEITPVKIVLQQKKRILEPLQYFYISRSQCFKCQTNSITTQNRISRVNSNKRLMSCQGEYETDGVVPICDNKPELRQSKSEPEPPTSYSSSSGASRPPVKTNQTNDDVNEKFLSTLGEKVEALFADNDLTQFLRICRPFIQKRPELLHHAINKNHSDLIVKFIPIASIDLLREKNQHGETVLFHVARLNRVDVVKALLEKENSDKLLEDVIDDKKQNIFHVLALNTNVDEILDLLINNLLKNSIDIREKFDRFDQDNHTPLQLAISQNNLSATRRLLKYSNNNRCKTSDYTGDNLVHLAVRFGDLTMLKYLIGEGKLIEQGNQSNLNMLPIELARAMKRNDMVQYLNEIYPQPKIEEDENSEND